MSDAGGVTPTATSQTSADFERASTVPLRQHVQSQIDSAEERARQMAASLETLVMQRIAAVEHQVSERMKDFDTHYTERLKASLEPVVTLREYVSSQMESSGRLAEDRLQSLTQRFEQMGASLNEGRIAAVKEVHGRIDTLISTKYEMNRQISEATGERLKEVARRFEEAQNMVTTAMSASEKAVLKAETANEKRFESVDEFRSQLNDMIRNLLPRGEADARFSALSEKIDNVSTNILGLQRRVDTREGTGAGMQQGWLILIGGVGAIAAMVGILNFATRSAEKPAPSVVIERVVPTPSQSGVTQP